MNPHAKTALREASGYLELVMPGDALETLENLPVELRCHPDVMGQRLELHMRLGNWEEAAGLAQGLTDCIEEEPQHWIWWAFATRRAESVEAAEEILEQALVHHPEVAIIHYNLACYAAVQGRGDDARRKLEQAAGLDPGVRVLAETDPDLVPLRDNQ